MLLYFATDPSVRRQQRVRSDFITKPSSTEENRCFTEDDGRRVWEVLNRGSINSSFLSLALTKSKEKLLWEETVHLLLWFTGSRSISPGSVTTIQPGLVLYQVANCFHLPGIYLVGQKPRLECVPWVNDRCIRTQALEPASQADWYIFGY